ncbi:hypothetical protein HMPREF0973_00483 [Prevotella veroralis F0319]|uniref:Uncharacterized protein n=1 Tax=Prevotella veroralis F0319 TaxID=649761 RepID=C9MLK8_9BACT|nr:hypothetical protein HMPREF0973_00483 [Prevotella veroralis F0319]
MYKLQISIISRERGFLIIINESPFLMYDIYVVSLRPQSSLIVLIIF